MHWERNVVSEQTGCRITHWKTHRKWSNGNDNLLQIIQLNGLHRCRFRQVLLYIHLVVHFMLFLVNQSCFFSYRIISTDGVSMKKKWFIPDLVWMYLIFLIRDIFLLINVSNIPTKLFVKMKLWCLYFKLHVVLHVFRSVKKKEKLNIHIQLQV